MKIYNLIYVNESEKYGEGIEGEVDFVGTFDSYDKVFNWLKNEYERFQNGNSDFIFPSKFSNSNKIEELLGDPDWDKHHFKLISTKLNATSMKELTYWEYWE